MRRRHRLVTRLGVLGLGALLAVLLAAPAQAAGYRYWSFWQADGTAWRYATEGPATARPADGSVDGYRFSVSRDSADAAKPRRAPEFAAVCADTPAKEGTKRVALVIDYGTPADAPSGERPPALRTACARVAPDATSAEALASVAKPLRYDSSAMLCAIAGYPSKGCGDQVPDGPSSAPAPAASGDAASDPAASGDEGDGAGPTVGVVAGAAAVLALGGAALWRARRRAG
ncbi:SCO2322 family protein [Streptomyces sp. NPDC005805]|uniref:SCO2322 family protein n=1 Tax=Streptomyces sp. NPDC005805 TaxID=3157068 RepID=UPI0033CAF53F